MNEKYKNLKKKGFISDKYVRKSKLKIDSKRIHELKADSKILSLTSKSVKRPHIVLYSY